MSGTPPVTSNPYWKQDVAIGRKEGVSPYLLSAQQWFESRWDPSAVSPTGAFGLSQFEPGTAADYGVQQGTSTAAVDSQITGQARYLKALYAEEHNWTGTLEAYNTGPAGDLASAEGYASGILGLAGARNVGAPGSPTTARASSGSGGGRRAVLTSATGEIKHLALRGLLVLAGAGLILLGLIALTDAGRTKIGAQKQAAQ
jgi:hypothetical protein